jgi:hypothetical protein
MQDIALKVEQIETGTEQSATRAFTSAVGQGFTTFPGTVFQGFGAMVGSTKMEEAGKQYAEEARSTFPIDPLRREDLSTKAGQAVGQGLAQLGLALGTGGGSLSTGAVLASAAGMGAASGAERSAQDGLTGARRMGRVYGSALVELGSERIFGLGSKSFLSPTKIPNTLGGKALRAAGTAAGEGGEEIIAGVGNNILDNLTAVGLDIPTPDIVGMKAFKSYAEQGFLGMVGGTVFAGAQLALGGQATENPITEEDAAQAPTPGAQDILTRIAQENQAADQQTAADVLTRAAATNAAPSVTPPTGAAPPVTPAPGAAPTDVDPFVPSETLTPEDRKAVAVRVVNDLRGFGNLNYVAIARALGKAQINLQQGKTDDTEVFSGLNRLIPAKTLTRLKDLMASEGGVTSLKDVLTQFSQIGGVAQAAPSVAPLEPTQTPPPDATQVGPVPENDLGQYPNGNEVGTPTEAGDSNRPVEGGQVEQAPVVQEQEVAPAEVLTAEAPVQTYDLTAGPTAARNLDIEGIRARQKAKKAAPKKAAKAAPVPTAPATPQDLVDSIQNLTDQITGEAAPAPTEQISPEQGAVPTGSLPAAEAPMTGVSGGGVAPTMEAVPTPAPTAAASDAAPAPTTAAAAPAPTTAAPAAAPALPSINDIVVPPIPEGAPPVEGAVNMFNIEDGEPSQFFSEENPLSPKEVQSYTTLTDELIVPSLFNGSAAHTPQNKATAYKYMALLQTEEGSKAVRDFAMKFDPVLGDNDALNGGILGQVYIYANAENDGGKMLSDLRSIGSRFYYSKSGTGQSSARGLGIVGWVTKNLVRAKAMQTAENGRNKDAASNSGVASKDLEDLGSAVKAAVPTTQENQTAFGEATTSAGSVDDVLSSFVGTVPVDPVIDTRVTPGEQTPADVAPAVQAEQERLEQEAKGQDPETNEQIGENLYTKVDGAVAAPTINATKARELIAKKLGFTPKNVTYENTDIPNENGNQYSGKVNLATKQITINLRNIKDSAHLTDVLIEEMDHLVYADPMVQAEISLLSENLPDDIKAEVASLNYKPEVQKEEATIRFMRRLASEPNTSSLWKRFVDSVRAAFRRLFNGRLTERDLKMAADRVAARSFRAMAAQSNLTGTQSQSAARSPEAIRHSELEAKFNAGTITPAETAEAKRLVEDASGNKPTVFRGQKGFVSKYPKSSKGFLGFGQRVFPTFFTSSQSDATDYSRDGEYKGPSEPSAAAQRGVPVWEVTSESQFYSGQNKTGAPRSVTRKVYTQAEADQAAQQGDTVTKKVEFPKTPVVQSAKVFLKNPLVVDANNSIWNEIPFEGGKISTDNLAEYAFKNGFDGVQILNVRDSFDGMRSGNLSDLTISFTPEQVKSADTFTGVPLDQRFDLRQSDLRYSSNSSSPESQRIDQEYMAAVEAGDMETAQRLVDEAAKAAGGKTAFRYVSRDGIGMLNSKAYNIDKLNDDDASDLEEWLNYGLEQPRDVAQDQVFYFTEDGKLTNEEGLRLLKKAARKGFFEEVRFVFGEPSWATNDGQIAVNPNQIKSADPITRDDAGNIIPPSQRFNPASSDIRYSVTPDPNEPAPAVPDVGPNAYTEEVAAVEAVPEKAKQEAAAKVKKPKAVAKVKADPNEKAVKDFIAAFKRNSGVEKTESKPKIQIKAKEILARYTKLPTKGKSSGYVLTEAGRDAFMLNLSQELVNEGVPADLAAEASAYAWARYSTKRQKQIDAKQLKKAQDKIKREQGDVDKPNNTAKAFINKQDLSQTETLTGDKQKKIDPVAQALSDWTNVQDLSTAFDSSPQARNAYMTGLSSKLMSLGVDSQTAWTASNRAWIKYQTALSAKVEAFRRRFEANKASTILGEELSKIPVYLQNDVEFVKAYFKKLLIFGGIPEQVAEAATTMYTARYIDLLKSVKTKRATRFIENEASAKTKKVLTEKPNEYTKLMTAVRLGVTDPSHTVSMAFSSPSKYQVFTQADHDQMIAWEKEIHDGDTPNLIKVELAKKILGLADARMNDFNAINAFTGYLVGNTLSGIGTAAIQLWTPAYSMGNRLATDGMRGLITGDPKRFFASLSAFMNSADTVTKEFKYAFGNDVYRRGQQAELQSLSALRKVLDKNIAIYNNPKSGKEKAVAIAKIALAAPDYVRRLYSSMDTASQSLFINQIRQVGLYDLLRKNGMDMKKFDTMLEAKRAYRDGVIATLTLEGNYTPTQIRLIAEDSAIEDFGVRVAEAIGEGGAKQVSDLFRTSVTEGKSEIGVADQVDGHVIPAILKILKGIETSVDDVAGEKGKGAGQLAFRVIVGYPTTALKVLNRSLYFFPPTAAIRYLTNRYYEKQPGFDPEAKRVYPLLETHSQKLQRLSEAVMGTMTLTILIALLSEDKDKEEKDRRFIVHNLGPTDRAAKQAWRAAGNVPQSIQWRASETSPWISVSWAKAGLEALAPILATVGTMTDVGDAATEDTKTSDIIIGSIGGVMGVFNRPLSGINDIGEILSGEKNSVSQKSLASYTAFRASGLVPFSSLLKTANRLEGPRDMSTATSTMLSQIPIAGPMLTEPAINMFGDPLGATPNEMSYKMPIFPVQVGIRRQDVPFYEKILSKGQYPPLKLRTNFEKTYGPVSDLVWRQYVEKRGQMVKKLIIDRWTDLDKLSPEAYDKVLGKFANAADDVAIQELNIRRLPK